MKRLSSFNENSSCWPRALFSEGRTWALTGLDGYVRDIRAGKRNPDISRGYPDGFRDRKPTKTWKSVQLLPGPEIFFLVKLGHQEEIVDQSGKVCTGKTTANHWSAWPAGQLADRPLATSKPCSVVAKDKMRI